MKKILQKLRNGTSLFLTADRVVFIIWMLVPLFAAFLKIISPAPCNNYLIYKGVYTHAVQQTNLYNLYPAEYDDRNHYGILFSILIAPFCLLPDWLGILFYQALQLLAFYWVVRQLPFSHFKQNALLLFVLVPVITQAQNCQTNLLIAFLLIATYHWITNRKEALAALAIVSGTLIKLYGVLGLGLFFFVKRKPRFILFALLISVVLFFLPLLITSFQFNVQSYWDWMAELKHKNVRNTNLHNVCQNLSFLGFVKRVSGAHHIASFVMIPALLLQLLPLRRIQVFRNPVFQLRFLASLLLFIILFNTATESSTYIIGASGAAIWWLSSSEFSSRRMLWFIAFVFIIGMISTTDLVPDFIDYGFVRKYAMSAVPYFIVWLLCIYQLNVTTYTNTTLAHE